MAKILLLNGPPAAGKSTVSKLFLESQKPNEWAYISHDDIRQLVKSGYSSADGTREMWNEETEAQWAVGVENCVDLAINFQQDGISCIVDFYATEEDFKQWQELLGKADYVQVILLPNKAIDVARNAQRKPPAHLTNKKMAESYEAFKSWANNQEVVLIDNSAQTAKQTVKHLRSLLKDE